MHWVWGLQVITQFLSTQCNSHATVLWEILWINSGTGHSIPEKSGKSDARYPQNVGHFRSRTRHSRFPQSRHCNFCHKWSFWKMLVFRGIEKFIVNKRSTTITGGLCHAVGNTQMSQGPAFAKNLRPNLRACCRKLFHGSLTPRKDGGW